MRMMRERRTNGRSLREIAGRLKAMLAPTKHGGVWQANTVRRILKRS